MKQNKFNKEESSKFSHLILSQLKGISHIDLLIIKGHILIEYAMNKFIDDFSEHNKSIEDTRFTFYQKVQICKILGLFFIKENDELEIEIIALNKLRNEIAHKLTFTRETLETLFKYHPDEEKVLERFKPHTRDLKMLRWIIMFMCGNIIGRLEGKKEIRQ